MNNLADKRAYWFNMIKEQETSEISQAAFCKEKSLKIHQFHYYLKLLKNESISQEEIKNKVVPIQIKSTQNNSIKEFNEIRVLLQNGIQCVLPSDMDAEQIGQVVKALLSC
ncbi:MAG: hypothetical protein H0W88_12755 [Parachlamydiaceae bacterium]|nr:hypothetical protein [Parachlamydiaceae bacterium]